MQAKGARTTSPTIVRGPELVQAILLPGHIALIGTTAFITTTVTAPLVRQLLVRWAVIDTPNQRSSHQRPVPRGGGVACALGVVLGYSAAYILGGGPSPFVLVTALTLSLIGFLDDRFTLGISLRLTAQILCGAVLGATTGGLLGALLGAVALPLAVNIVNFMDGVDGITSLTLLVWGATTTALGLGYGAPTLAIAGAVTMGAAAGFLPWNVSRHKMFLGDVGSYLFGALAGATFISFSTHDIPLQLLIAPLGIYIADVTYTLVRRMHRRARIFEAHREHIYQRLAPTPRHHVPVASLAALLSVCTTVTAFALFSAGLPGVLPLALSTLLFGGVYMLMPTLLQRRNWINR